MRWQVFQKNMNIGLKTSEEIVQLIASGAISLSDFVAKEGSPVKRRIADAHELFARKTTQSLPESDLRHAGTAHFGLSQALDRTIVKPSGKVNIAGDLNHSATIRIPENGTVINFQFQPLETIPLEKKVPEPESLETQPVEIKPVQNKKAEVVVAKYSEDLSFLDSVAKSFQPTSIQKAKPKVNAAKPEGTEAKSSLISHLSSKLSFSDLNIPEQRVTESLKNTPLENASQPLQKKRELHDVPDLHLSAQPVSVVLPKKNVLPLVNLKAAQQRAQGVNVIVQPPAEKSSPLHQKPRAKSEGNLNLSAGHMAWENSRVNETSQAAVFGKEGVSHLSSHVDRRQVDRRRAQLAKLQQAQKSKSSNSKLVLAFAGVCVICLVILVGAFKYKQKKERAYVLKLATIQKVKREQFEFQKNQAELAERKRDEQVKREINQRKEENDRTERERLQKLASQRRLRRTPASSLPQVKNSGEISKKRIFNTPQESSRRSKTAQSPTSSSNGLVPNKVGTFSNVQLAAFPIPGCSPCVATAQLADGTPVNLVSPSFVQWFQVRKANDKKLNVEGFVQKKSDGSYNIIVQKISK